MGKHSKAQTAQEQEAQAKADQFDARHGASVTRAADKRLTGTYPYDQEAKLADLKTGRQQR